MLPALEAHVESPRTFSVEAVEQALGVFFVDDCPMVRQAIELSIRHRASTDNRLKWCGSLHQADELVPTLHRLHMRGEMPDVIVLDYDMPGRHPLDATRELRVTFPQLQIIYFTAKQRDEVADAVFEAGADSCVSKDRGLQALVEEINIIASERRYGDTG